jgi:hypothetical protein
LSHKWAGAAKLPRPLFSVDIVVERPGFAQAGQPRRLSPHGFVSLMMPHAIPVKKNQHFVYLKSRNEVIV